MHDLYLVIRYTRNWIHYGMLSHVVICVVVAGIKGIFAR